MNSGNANVVEMLHLVAHHLSRDNCFFGNWNIRLLFSSPIYLASLLSPRMLKRMFLHHVPS